MCFLSKSIFSPTCIHIVFCSVLICIHLLPERLQNNWELLLWSSHTPFVNFLQWSNRFDKRSCPALSTLNNEWELPSLNIRCLGDKARSGHFSKMLRVSFISSWNVRIPSVWRRKNSDIPWKRNSVEILYLAQSLTSTIAHFSAWL